MKVLLLGILSLMIAGRAFSAGYNFKKMGAFADPLKLNQRSVAQLCYGDKLSRMAYNAKRRCRDKNMESNELCEMTGLKWINRNGIPNVEEVKNFLMDSEIAESVRGIDEFCLDITRNITRVRGNLKKLGNVPNWIEQVMQMKPDCGRNTQKCPSGSAWFFAQCVNFKFKHFCGKKANALMSMMANSDDKHWKEGWKDTGVIPDKIEEIPKPALVSFSSGATAKPGHTITTDLMIDPPLVYWDANPQNYYTLMVEDVDLSDGGRYMHYLLYNVPGNSLNRADVAFDWVRSFAFKVDNSGDEPKLSEDPNFAHNHLYLVYRQPGKIRITEGHTGCNEELLTGDRLKVRHEELAEKYGLIGPIAGNVLRIPYTEATNEMLCYYTRCTGNPFPLPLVGINDDEACKEE